MKPATLALFVLLNACTASSDAPAPNGGKRDDATDLSDPTISMTGLQKAQLIDALINTDVALSTYPEDNPEAAIGELVDGFFANTLGSPWLAGYRTQLACSQGTATWRCVVTASFKNEDPEDDARSQSYMLAGDIALDETGSPKDGVFTFTNVVAK